MPPLWRAVLEKIGAVSPPQADVDGVAAVLRKQRHVLQGQRRREPKELQGELGFGREANEVAKTVLAGKTGFRKRRDARWGKLRWVLPAVACMASLIGVVGGQQVDAAQPRDFSGNETVRRANVAAARESAFQSYLDGLRLMIEDAADNVRLDIKFVEQQKEEHLRYSYAETAPMPITADNTTGPQSAESWASTAVVFFCVSVALWAIGSSNGRGATAGLVTLAASPPATMDTRLELYNVDIDHWEMVSQHVWVTAQQCTATAASFFAAGVAVATTWQYHQDADHLMAEQEHAAEMAHRMDDAERRCQRKVRKAAETAANAELEVAQVRAELNETRGAVKLEKQRHQTEISQAVRALSAEEVVSADLRRSLSAGQKLSTALRTELERRRQATEVAVRAAKEEAERRCRREAGAAAEIAARKANRQVAQMRTEMGAITRREVAAVQKMLSTKEVDLEGVRCERDEAQTRNVALAAELADSKRSLTKVVADLRSAQAELAAAKGNAQKGGTGGNTFKNDPASCGLKNGGNQCSLNSCMQTLRHWPLFQQGVVEASRRRDAEVAELDASQTKLPLKGPRETGDNVIPETLASITGVVFQALDEEKKGTGFSSTFAKDHLPNVDGLKHGQQADAAEVMDGIFDALSGVGPLQPALEAVKGRKMSHFECARGRTHQLPAEPFTILTLPMEPLGKGGGDGAGGKGRQKGKEGGRGKGGGKGKGRGKGGGGGTSAPSVPGILRKVFMSKVPCEEPCRDCTSLNGEKEEPHKRTRSEWIEELPAQLFLQLGRASFQGGKSVKLTHKVEIPLELDMREFTAKEGEAKYDLVGVVNHTSSKTTAQGGHYYAHIRTGADTWRLYNDEKVKTIELGEVLTNEAVILSYARRV